MTTKQLSELLRYTIPAKLPVLITGSPGIGKTDVVKLAGKNAGADLIIMHPVVSDPTDFKGFPAKIVKDGKETATFLPFNQLSKMINADRLTVVFLDDLGQAAASVQAAAMQLILERRINGFRVSDNVVFTAATNRRQDKAGVTGILEPVKSRFAAIVELEVNVNDWCEWAINTGLPAEIIAFIRFRPELLYKFEPTKEIINTPSPRTVHNLAKLFTLGLPDELQFEAFKGATGEGFTAEFMAFLKMYKLLPSIDKILIAPDSVECPSEPSQLFAISTALAGRINDVNASNAFKFISKMPLEFQTLCVKDLMTRNKEAHTLPAFAGWAIKNGNEIL